MTEFLKKIHLKVSIEMEIQTDKTELLLTNVGLIKQKILTIYDT